MRLRIGGFTLFGKNMRFLTEFSRSEVSNNKIFSKTLVYPSYEFGENKTYSEKTQEFFLNIPDLNFLPYSQKL